MRVMGMQGPPVVDVEVEDAENQYQHNSGEFGLETDDNHDASDKSEEAGHDAPEAPVATEDKSNEEKDEEDTTSELEVHLLVLLVERRQAGRSELLANPRVGEHHQQASHDGKIAEEEVQVKHQAVAESLENHNTDETRDSVFRVLPSDDHDRADRHEDDVYNEK